MDVSQLTAYLEARLPSTLGLLEELVSLNSYTLNREGVNRNGALIAGAFTPLGFLAEFVPPAARNHGDHLFLTRRGTGDKALLLVTHLDTVFPPEEEKNFRWQREGDRIYGPGTSDIKGGTAMIHLVLSAIREMAPALFDQTTWLVAANSAEEVLCFDFPERCRERLPPGTRAALVFESCGAKDALVQARKGSANFTVTVEGRAAHAGGSHGDGANALVELGALLQRIAAITDYERHLTANPGWGRGGGPVNRVPHQAECRVNLRAFDDAVLDDGIAAMMALADHPPTVRAASDNFPCKVGVTLTSRNPAWPCNPDTDRLIALWKQAAATVGRKLSAGMRGGLSDGNHLSKFVPTLDGLGPFGDNDHCSERNADGSKVPEFVEVRSFIPVASTNVLGIAQLLAD